MNELLKIEINENQEQVVSGRLLHEFLQINTPYAKWFGRMCEYGFTENVDFITVGQKCPIANGGYQTRYDHILKLGMAKELCMLARNERGKQARKYFIKCEEAWNSQDMVLARALKIMNGKLENKTKELEAANQFIEQAKPKLSYYEKILASKGTMKTTQIAKDYGMSAQRLNKVLNEAGFIWKCNGQWVLYAKYDNLGYVDSVTYEYDGGSHCTTQTVWTQRGRLKIHQILTSKGFTANCDKNNQFRINTLGKQKEFDAKALARQLA